MTFWYFVWHWAFLNKYQEMAIPFIWQFGATIIYLIISALILGLGLFIFGVFMYIKELINEYKKIKKEGK